MGFSSEIKSDILVNSARHCCVCHRYRGLKIEVHHIEPSSKGGGDTLENAIALCFDCHADAGHYFAGHPKGSKLSSAELLKHKIAWFKNVKENKIEIPKETSVYLSINNKDFEGVFKPIFIKETIRYIGKSIVKNMYETMGIDPMISINEYKIENKKHSIFFDSQLSKINNYDEYLDYLSSDIQKFYDESSKTNCQPILHKLGAIRSFKELNKSNCVLELKLSNLGPEILENYKVYLKFENIVSVNRVQKNTSIFDTHKYEYNVKFIEKNKGEFIPNKDILVQNDSVLIDSICFRPDYNFKFVILEWELFAKDFNLKGILKLKIEPIFEKLDSIKYGDSRDCNEIDIRVLPKIEHKS